MSGQEQADSAPMRPYILSGAWKGRNTLVGSVWEGTRCEFRANCGFDFGPLIYDNMMDNPRNADQPIVFNVYSKYMKDDMENLIRESIRRNEEERTRFLTLLNSDTSANFKRRKHKRMSITAGKILKARFGGSLHYYNHLR